jgi:YebC/PmpR family DNA-binding regulatory protein
MVKYESMSGHSHYAQIHRQKGLNDAKKGNLFSKLARAISIAVKDGGASPDSNLKLRVAIEKAREASMPKENVERAIAKGSGGGEDLTEVVYEGFGPFGVAVMVEAATDNKNRTAQEIKNIFERAGGSLAGPGAVSFNFESKGFMLIKKSSDVESQMLQLIDAGVEDVLETEDGIEVYVAPEKLGQVHKTLGDKGFEILQTELQMKPKNPQIVENPVEVEKVIKFLDDLEDQEDVQKVFTNLDVPEETMPSLKN